MEICAFYGESGLRNFEARNYMEKLDFGKLVIFWRFGLFFIMEIHDSVILKLQALKVFKYIPCTVLYIYIYIYI